MQLRRLRYLGLTILSLLLAACSGPAPSFTLALNPTILTVQQGSSGTTTLTVTPQNGFTGTVALSLAAGQDPVPQGLTLSPPSVQVSGANPVSQTLTLSASSTPTGTYRLKVRGTAQNLTREADLTVTVSAPPGGGGNSSGTVNTPGGQVQVVLQGGTFAQGPTAQSVTPPSGYQAPYGAIAFTAQVAQGGTLTVSLTFPQAIPQGAVLRKYLNNAWREIPGAQLSGNTATYQVVDGGPLDADGRANGQVVDPVALLVPSSGGGGGGGGGGGAPQISFEPSVQPPLYFVRREVSPERNLGVLTVQPGTYRGQLTLEVLYRRNNSFEPEEGPYSLVPNAISVTGSDPIRIPLKLQQVGSYPHPANAHLDYLAFQVKREDGTILTSFEIGDVRNVDIYLHDCYNYDLEPDAEGRWHLGAMAGIGGKACVGVGGRLALRFSLRDSSGLRVVKDFDDAPPYSISSNYHVYFGGAPASEGVYTGTLRVEPGTPGTFSYVEFPVAFHLGSKVVFSDYDGILVVAPRTSNGTEFGVYRSYTDASSYVYSGYAIIPAGNPFPYLRGPIWWRYSYFGPESLVATDLRTFTNLGPVLENDGRSGRSDLPCTKERRSPRMILSDGTIICLVGDSVRTQQYEYDYYKVYRITPSQGVAEENIPKRIPYPSSCEGFAYREDQFDLYGYGSTFWLRPGAAYFYYLALMPHPDPTVGCGVPQRNFIPYRYSFASRSLQPISSIPSRGGSSNGHYYFSPRFYNSNVHVSGDFVCVPSSQPDHLDDCLAVPSGYTAVGEQPSADPREWLVLLRSNDGSFRVWKPFASGGSRFLGNPVSPQGSVAGYALAYPWLVLALVETSGTTGPSWHVIQAINVLDGRVAPGFLKPWSRHIFPLYPAWRQ